MTCHSQIFTDSPLLQPVRDSYASGRPIRWNRVHDLPDYVYFNHAIHVNKGVEKPMPSALPEAKTSKIAAWRTFEGEMVGVLRTAAEAAGDGLVVLTEPSTSPTFQRQMKELLKKLPRARWYQWAPWASLGQPFSPEPDFERADLIVAIGSDFLVELPGPTVAEGSWANNGWLQELPKPLTKLTWDNAALVSPALAQRLGIANGDVVELHCQGQMVEAPVWILPGQADRCVTAHLGYGRTHAGSIGNGRGFDAYRLQCSAHPWLNSGLEIRKTGRRYDLVTTQHHHSMEGRNIVRAVDLPEFRRDPHFAVPEPNTRPSLLPSEPPLGSRSYAWAMTVDLSLCTGCNACVVACQAENNIAVVGKEQVAIGREMHWIRIDRYFEGSLEDPAILHQPVLCMHCEKAPCEIVCPVAATVHNDEGLNTMIYNRCVGTRYCSNNCPYKVRRFNFLEYSPPADSVLAQRQNPNVTVRRRGVMEKCTYCVQRINAARVQSDLENRRIRDGEIVTACQQACPAEAIVFGDSLDPESAVSKRRSEPVNYGLLAQPGRR